ncbi:TPA: hypothetical protein I7730_00130 [Vibrio vulnificus]|uniref:DUF6884 domain-containing protein n=1 Tax=Vibrio vulnificus TaxID=672 RepID=A0A8H9K4Z8_VIBVL|nr:hypothetical protein [Vibrio vulnificus]HAS8538205.1 hypothetical protein [Vibrio vulnificus]
MSEIKVLSGEAKPVLVISCSDKKLDSKAPAFDIYDGGIFKMLRANMSNPLDFFEVLILSAEHGLLSADDIIEPYDKRMCSRNKEKDLTEYAEKHGDAAKKLLYKVSRQSRDVYVALSNDYLAAFDLMLGGEEGVQKLLGRFQNHYISRGHTGIGDLRGRLTRIIKNVTTNSQFPITNFRSGVANFPELGYLAAGCDIGASLAHTNRAKGSDLLSALLNATNSSRLFLDNGIITMVNEGKQIDTDWVFDEYEAIINSLKPRQAKNVSIVVPDDVFDNQAALDIVHKYAPRIMKLAAKCDVILPIHRSEDIKKHAMSMMEALGYRKGIRLGVPCLTKKDLDFALSVKDIDALLSLKNPKHDGVSLFEKAHFFGMSEATGKMKLQPRLLIAKLHGIDLSVDCCRTTAVFGKTKSGFRKGTVATMQIEENHIKKQVVSSEAYNLHTFEVENGTQPQSVGFEFKHLTDMINSDEVFMFIELFNALIAETEHYLILDVFDDADDAIEACREMVLQPDVEYLITSQIGEVDWKKFKAKLVINHELESEEERKEGLRDLIDIAKDTSFYSEFNSEHSSSDEDCVTGYLYEGIFEGCLGKFWSQYNELMVDYPDLKMEKSFTADEAEEEMELFCQLVGKREVQEILFNKLKNSNWETFLEKMGEVVEISPMEKRFEAIKVVFGTGESVPVQMPLRFCA